MTDYSTIRINSGQHNAGRFIFMSQSKYNVIVFDLGNVLLPFDFNIIYDELNDIEEGLGYKFKNLYTENYYYHQDLETSRISAEEFTNVMVGWLNNKVSRDDFCKIYSGMFSVNQDMVDLLPVLKQKYKLVLLSNTNIIHKEYGWDKYEFLKFFDHLVLSHEVGASKPDSRIYRTVEKLTGENPTDHFFIDDIKEYVDAAVSMGWGGLVFNGYENFINHLHSESIL